jgi:hypothetical protein
MSDTLRNLGNLRRETEELRRLEKESNDNREASPLWAVSYGEGAVDYKQDFGSLIKEPNLKAHLALKASIYRSNGKKYGVLDLLSPVSSFLKRIQKEENGVLTIDGGIACTLDDPRSKVKINADERNMLFGVAGDITLPEPRKELQKYMDKLGIKDIGFGAIFFRPMGGAFINTGEEEYTALYYSFLRQIWRLTSKDEGEIFYTVPSSMQEGSPIFDKWIHVMRNEIGASVDLTSLKESMKITRHPNSKDRLPGLKELGVT